MGRDNNLKPSARSTRVSLLLFERDLYNGAMNFFIILLLTTSCFAFSDKWSNQYQHSLNDHAFATFWGGIRRGLYWHHNRGEMIDLLPDLFKETLPVYIQSDGKQKDLWIFYPGVFGKPDGRINPSVIDVLEEKDVHVAVIPNIIAPTYLVARPIPSRNLEAEKRNQENILKAVIKKIGSSKIKRINIVAESLGSFQALTALANNELGYHSLTLLWPPLYLDRSLVRFDQLIEQEKRKLETCTLWWKWPKILYQTKWSDTSNLDLEDKTCLGAWVLGSAFVDAIKETSKAYLNAKSKDEKVPDTFSGFMKTVLPEFSPLIDSQDNRLSMAFLLKRLKKNNNIRIFSSIDDFLNVPEEWEELKKEHPEIQDIYLFPWGGHSGPLGIEELLPEILTARDYSHS